MDNDNSKEPLNDSEYLFDNFEDCIEINQNIIHNHYRSPAIIKKLQRKFTNIELTN